MFGIGGPELVVILIVALLFVGHEKLPQVARTVSTGLRDLRRAANLAQSELRETMDELVREVDLEDRRRQAPQPPAPNAAPVHSAPLAVAPAQAAPLGVDPDEPHAAASSHLAGPPVDGETFAVIPRRTASVAVPGQDAEPGLAEALAAHLRKPAAPPLAGTQAREMPRRSAAKPVTPAADPPQPSAGDDPADV